MKTQLSILAILLTFAFLSCKNESSTTVQMNYQHSDKPSVVNCKGADSTLIKEVLYTFENDITKLYDPQNNNVNRAYSSFARVIPSGRIDYTKLVSEHTLEVYNALKTTSLWKDGGLNYENEFFSCLGENMKDPNLKTTYNSLISSGYMSNKLFGPPLANKSSAMANDKYLATFIALDFYFAHLEGVKPQPELPQIEKANDGPVDFNKVPAKTIQQLN